MLTAVPFCRQTCVQVVPDAVQDELHGRPRRILHHHADVVWSQRLVPHQAPGRHGLWSLASFLRTLFRRRQS